ncbi:hypothetical protein BD626DRAFT_564563 [Schizophyllum amplum]|uniref:Uncharacterized protein n=1 Tax=Schizophyllum amplum TaxID=97359 RepID=A0A550CS79_9AGAR|nr:hypothetical protein BD626DRAFT_564563 [Auriculariopsis ampla]
MAPRLNINIYAVLQQVEQYMMAVERNLPVCHPLFVAQLLALEKYIKSNSNKLLATRMFAVLGFFRRHVLDIVTSDHQNQVLKEQAFTQMRCHSIQCVPPKYGEHRELAGESRSGIEIMLDIITWFDEVDIFLREAVARPPSTSIFNCILAWLMRAPNDVAPYVVRHATLMSSPPVLFAFISVLARGDMNRPLVPHVSYYVAQCNDPRVASRQTWLNFLRSLDQRDSITFVAYCTRILNWLDVHPGEAASSSMRNFRQHLVDNAAYVALVHGSNLSELSCHREIIARVRRRSQRR